MDINTITVITLWNTQLLQKLLGESYTYIKRKRACYVAKVPINQLCLRSFQLANWHKCQPICTLNFVIGYK